MTITVSRTYDHKTFGRIGTAELTVSADKKGEMTFNLNGTDLPASSVDHLLTFALQTLQDAYAGAENEADAKERFEGKLGRILEGTLGTRSGSGVSALQAAIRYVLRSAVKESFDKHAGEGSWKALDEADRNAAIDAAFEQQDDDTKAAITALAQEELDRRAAEAAAKAGLKAKLSIKL